MEHVYQLNLYLLQMSILEFKITMLKIEVIFFYNEGNIKKNLMKVTVNVCF